MQAHRQPAGDGGPPESKAWQRWVVGALGERLVEAGWRAGDDQHQVACLAAEFADSHEWAMAGYSTPGRWIADRLDIARRTANEWIRVGRALRELPLISRALGDRVISFAKAKVLTRVATAETEAVLLEMAQVVSASNLTKAIAVWSAGSEDDAIVDARQDAARSLTWRTEPDGMVLALLRLPPGGAGVLMATVDTAVIRDALTGKEIGDDDTWPSLAQQRADALIGLLADGQGNLAVEVVLHVRGDGATLDDGTPITESAVARLLPDAFIRVLIHDADRRPINASGRRRHPTARQRRVVAERDRVCVDCGSGDLLEFDHVPSYAVTGRTVVEELELRCATCHRFRHR